MRSGFVEIRRIVSDLAKDLHRSAGIRRGNPPESSGNPSDIRRIPRHPRESVVFRVHFLESELLQPHPLGIDTRSEPDQTKVDMAARLSPWTPWPPRPPAMAASGRQGRQNGRQMAAKATSGAAKAAKAAR